MTTDTGMTSVAKERAKRLKSLREMTGLSRSAFHQRYGIPRGTLQNWESARFGGLTEKGAKNITHAFKAEGILCSASWLLHGTGSSPTFVDSFSERKILEQRYSANNDSPEIEKEHRTITQEILLFRQHHKHAIDMVVTDDSMAPFWEPGNYIAGVKMFQEDILKTLNKCCILQTKKYGVLFRYLKQGDEPNLYHLHAINYKTTVKTPVLYNVEVTSSAIVVWTRKIDAY